MAAGSDILIVGSGPAGAMAAWALRHAPGVRMLDVGHLPGGGTGPGVEHLRPGSRPGSLKLRGPAVEFITRDASRLAPVVSNTFPAVVSLAKGGLGNAWGAGVYRFQPSEFAYASLLGPHYDAVSRHIGICGAPGDLDADFGVEPSLQPPLRIGANARALLAAYQRVRPSGVRMGHARLAVRSADYSYQASEFTSAGDPARYSPSSTIDALPKLDYLRGWLVQRFRETADGVEVDALSLDGTSRTFLTRRLVLAAGALNTARIVLASYEDYVTRLPLLDNPLTVLPFVRWRSIGEPAREPESAMAQLNVVLDAVRFGAAYQGSVYGTRGVPLSEFVTLPPFSIRANLSLLRCLMPAVSLAMIFHPSVPGPGQYVRLSAGGALEAEYPWIPAPRLVPELVRLFRSLGFFTHSALARHMGPGQGIHYAGTLPMAERPERYQLHPDGRLEGTRAVYVCDGSCFPSLPAKNHTFTIMANAHRIASGLQ